MPEPETLGERLVELAKSHEEYDTFREAALAIIPESLRPSIGPHLMDFYLETRYPDAR